MHRSLFTGKPYAWLPGLIILLMVVTLALAAIALHEIEGRLVGSAGETLALAAAEIADKVDWFLDERARYVQAIARAPILHATNRAGLTNYLAGVKAAYPDYVWIGFMDERGLVVAATDPTTVGLDRSRSHYFQKARDGGRIIWEDVEPVEGTVGVDAVGWAVPVFGPRGEFRGVISTRIGLPLLEDIQTKTIKLFQTQQGFLGALEYQFLTSKGDAFIDSDLWHKGLVNLKRLALPSVLSSESGDPGFVEEEHLRRHVPVITGYAKTAERQGFKGSRWTILIRADRADVVAPIRTTLWKLGATGALIYLPLLAILLWTGRNVRREWVKATLERARATAAETKYRLLLESTGEGIYGLDMEGRCTFINPAAAAMLGYEPGALLGKSMHQFVHHSRSDGSLYPSEECFIHRASTQGEGCRVDDEVLWRRDGTKFPVVYTSHPIVKDGVVMGAVVTFQDTTEHKRAEEALREKEHLLSESQRIAHIGSWLCDLTGRIAWSDETYRIYGVSPDTFTPNAKSFLDLVHPEDRPAMQAWIAACWAGEKPGELEFRSILPDGTVRFIGGRGELKRDAEGRPTHMAGTAQCITARKQAEALITGHEQVLEMIATCVPLAESLTALLRVLEAQSPGMLCSILLLDADDVHLRHCAAPGLPEEYCRAIDGCAIGPCAGSCGTAAFRREAVIVEDIATDPFWADYRGLALRHGLRACCSTPIFDAQRRVLGTFAMYYSRPARPTEHHLRLIEMATQTAAIAITKQREEEALQESEARLHLAVQASYLGPWDWDLRTNTVYFSPEWKRQIGYEEDEIPGRYEEWESRLHPEDREPTLAALRAYLEGQKPEYAVEFRLRHKDGSYRWIYTRGEVVRDADGKPSRMLGCHIDITERKQAGLAIEELARQQEAVADLGQQALAGMDLQELMRAVVQVTARMLEVELCKVLELLPDGKALLLRAGVGWKEGFVGQASVSVGLNSQAGYTLASVHPVIVEDLRTETRFSGPPLLHDHGVISGMSVIIQGGHRPYGVLGAHTTRRRSFSADDINFLQAMANILGQAIQRKRAEGSLKLFRALLDQANDAIEVIDPAIGCFLDCNEKACSSLGYTREEFLSLAVPDIDPIVTLPIFTQYMTQFREVPEGGALTLETVHRRKDGSTFPVEANCRLVRLDREYVLAIVRDLTERKRAERALSESERRFRILAAASPTGIFENDATGRCVYVNERATELAGLSAGECLDFGWTRALFEEDRDRIQKRWRQAVGTRQPFREEYRFRHADGTVTWVIGQVVAVTDTEGCHSGFIGTLTDITQRKLTEEALRSSEERYRSLAEVLPVGVFRKNPQGQSIYHNPEWSKIVGMSDEDARGEGWARALHPDDRERIFNGWLAMVRDKGLFQAEYRFVKPDGTIVWVYGQAGPEYGTDGQLVGYVGSITDTTERKRAEEVLRQHEAQFRFVIDHANDAILYLNLNGVIQWASRQAVVLTGRPIAELVGHPIMSVLGPEDTALAVARLAAVCRGEPVPPLVKFEIIRGGAEKICVEANIASVEERGSVVGRLLVARDITERKKAEEALRQSEERLRQALDEREHLSQDLHDNIIQSIFAVGLSLEEYEQRPHGEPGNRGQPLSQAITTLNRVIADVRGYIEADPEDEVTGEQVPALLRRAARSLKGSHTPDFRMKLDRGALAQLPHDAAKQVLFIVREAMSNSAWHSDATRCWVSLREEQGRVHLEVRDDGEGFDVSAQPASGRGLGNIAARVRTLGGRLQILSEPGKGARILVDFAKEGYCETAQHDRRS